MKPTHLDPASRRIPAPAAAQLAALTLVALAVLAATVAARPAAAQQAPADAVLRDFEPTGDYVLEVDGQPQSAQIYSSDRVPAFMIISSKLPAPTLLMPRSGTVETVSVMKLSRRADGNVDILADADLTPAGRFTIDAGGENILFTAGGHKVALKQKPYLLGLQDLKAMLDYSVDYQRSAAGYKPAERALAALRNGTQSARVRVYFGTWCPHCKHFLPYMLKVAEALKGSKLSFEFYGLPKPFNGEPQAEADNISGVPTGVVWVGGKEIGRIEGDAWRSPEDALDRILNKRVGG